METGQRIRHFRQLANLTQAQLAAKIGASRQTVGAYETGERTVSKGAVIDIAAALDCRVGDLAPEFDADFRRAMAKTAPAAGANVPDDARRVLDGLAKNWETLTPAERDALKMLVIDASLRR